MKVSPTKSSARKPGFETQNHSRSRSKTLSSKKVQNYFYFCHYKNAMYMGGMKSFNRNGEGIIIHDNGTSMVCSYYNDLKHGHNISYLDNCIMSMFYEKNKLLECVVRLPNYLLLIKYNKQAQIDGKGVLINYEKRAVTYLLYKKNVLINRKEEKQYTVLNRVFDLDNLEFLLGLPHCKALRFQIQKSQNIGVIKNGAKISIGFCKRGMLNGLGFTISTKDPAYNSESSRNPSLYLRPVERGYFQNSQLSGMGQKWFKNGNYYIGEFKDSVFEGRGILKNSGKNNWVSGCFSKGNMEELIQYSNEGNAQRFIKLIEMMHQRKSSWMSKQVIPENPEIFSKEIQKIVNDKTSEQKRNLQERKQEVLRKIQDNFICDDSSTSGGINESLYLKVNPKQIKQSENEAENIPGQVHDDDSSFSSPYRSGEKKTALQESQGRTIYNIKLIEVPHTNEKELSSKRKASPSPNPYDASGTKNKLGSSQKSVGFSQIRQQDPSFKLDSKRMIGRSRLFKYSNHNEEEDLPSFSFTPKR